MQVISLLKDAKPPKNTTPEEGKVISALRHNRDLVILPADEGNATIMMDHEEYNRKIQEMLDDDQTYRKLKKDPALH